MVKLNVSEVYELMKAQKAYDDQENRNFKLSLLLVRNSKVLKGVIDDFEEAKKMVFKDEDVKKYQEARQMIINDHRIKTEKGGFETSNVDGQMVYKLERLEELNKKLVEFDDQHKDITERITEAQKNINKQMEEEIELELKCITTKEYIDALDKDTLVILAPIIKMSLTNEVLGDKGDKLTVSDMERLMKYCEVRD